MSGRGTSGDVRRLWVRNLLIWVAPLVLLLLSLVAAYIPMGRMTTASGIVIAAAKSTLVVLLLCNSTQRKP